MCNEAVEVDPYTLRFIPNHFKTQKMCDDAVEKYPSSLNFVPVHLRTHEMYRAFEKYLHPMRDVLKTEEMCKKAEKAHGH